MDNEPDRIVSSDQLSEILDQIDWSRPEPPIFEQGTTVLFRKGGGQWRVTPAIKALARQMWIELQSKRGNR